MTLQELLAKNAAIRAERERKAAQCIENRVEPSIIEEVEVVEEPVSEIKEETCEETVEKAQPTAKKKGKKPANRQYMVVDQDVILEEEEAVKSELEEETF